MGHPPRALCEGPHQPRNLVVDQPLSLLGPRPLRPKDHRVVSRATESLQGAGRDDPRSCSHTSSASCGSLHACTRAQTHTRLSTKPTPDGGRREAAPSKKGPKTESILRLAAPPEARASVLCLRL